MVKRLFAVGTGVAMLGATAMGAMAADLNNYPNMFVDNGRFNGFLVVGENAQAVDNLAMTDIAANMKVAAAAGGSSTVTVSGDAWKVGTSSKMLEMANNNATQGSVWGETFRDITNFIGDEEMKALADGTWATNEQSYDFQQFMFFDLEGAANNGNSRIVKYSENDDDETADHLFIKNSRQIARYRLEFTSTAQSDVTDSAGSATTTGTYLDDFDNTDISIMGKDYSVVLARRSGSGAIGAQNSIKLTLMAGSSRDTLLEGESKSYTVGGKTYEVELTFVDSDEAKFVVNGEATNKLKVGETYILSDKSEIGVSEVLYQSYAGGVHSSTFFVGAQKVVLQDDVITNSVGTYNVKVGSESIDGTSVIVGGTDDNTTFTISTIEINMTAEDDYFVGANEKLSDVIAAAGEEKEVLLAGSFDVEYKGLSEEATHDIKLKSSSSRRYKFTTADGDGNMVDLPIAYAEGQFNLSVGEDTQVGSARANWKLLHWNETAGNDSQLKGAIAARELFNRIYKDDYFVVTGGTQNPATDGAAKSYLLQYKGADRQTKTSPKIKFKNLGSGETLEYSVTSVTAGTRFGAVATIKLGGYSFAVVNGSGTLTDDFQVHVDQDGSGAVGTLPQDYVTWADSYGSEWTFYSGNRSGHRDNDGNVSTAAFDDVITLRSATPDSNDYDNVLPTIYEINITGAAGPEVRAALNTGARGPNLVTPDGETEVSYGWTSMGTFARLDAPSSDPQQLTLTYPAKQRLPMVYFTSGATSSGVSRSGNLVAVEVVDATKLDSEVASVTAQNLIVVGGPCVNTVAAELMGNQADCTTGFAPGKARVRLFEHANGNMAMLVAGYNGADTRLAGKVVANRPGELSGMEVEIEGTTASSATISRPVSTAAAGQQ